MKLLGGGGARLRDGLLGRPVPDAPEKWVPIFNGRDLSGWTPKFTGSPAGENVLRTFRVEDGLLTVSYDGWDELRGRFGHLFYERKLSHYRIRLEYRFVGKQVAGGPPWGLMNSGIMLHSEPPASMRVGQAFPVSIEAQFLGDDGTGKRTSGNLCSPGTHVVIDGTLVTEHCPQTSKVAVAPGRVDAVRSRGSRQPPGPPPGERGRDGRVREAAVRPHGRRRPARDGRGPARAERRLRGSPGGEPPRRSSATWSCSSSSLERGAPRG